MARTMRELTPLQRYVYAMSKDHHEEDVNVDTPSMNKAHAATRGF